MATALEFHNLGEDWTSKMGDELALNLAMGMNAHTERENESGRRGEESKLKE